MNGAHEVARATKRWRRSARAPYVRERDGEPMVAGDVRFDREAGLGFGEIEAHRETPLGGWVPTWEPPRMDVLDPAQMPAPRVHDIVTE